MFKQIKKLQQDAWPVIATVLVGTGGVLGYGVFQEETARGNFKNPIGATALLLLGAAGTAYAKGKNQLRRDKELGILDKDRNPTINAGNFDVATERYEGLDRQSTALTLAPGVVIATAAATATFAPVAFAPAAAAIGCGLVLTTMGLAAEFRKENLEFELENAADAIREGCDGNTVNAAAAACSFLGRQL